MLLFANLDFDYLPWSLAAGCVVLILLCWPRLHGTTLIAPAIWTIIAIVILAIAEDYLATVQRPSELGARQAMRYFAGVTSLCPAMALFGAKRPQHIAWQFIVISLWLVLCLPSIHWWLAGGGQAFGIHSAQSWFLLVLLFMTAANYLFTRFAISSVLISLAQLSLLQDYLPLGGRTLPMSINSLVPCAIAIFLAVAGWPQRKHIAFPLDRQWLDFRNAFGAVWALRVQQRVNQSATMYGWNVRLDWHGFQVLGDEAIPPQVARAVQNNLNNLLRRFVSPQWIARRIDEGSRSTNMCASTTSASEETHT